ncbi:hypothetical protein AAFF_G00384290 [Aldrovandia affinis]|uniref:Uncharacterized protein n=1 Tax=Aldrovandia affinis TaxID=143900 RepID=A0AAD7SF92_9TELE|nr:hypothetical protein AAFF_G00384290 [Aldrovandia affinis]
MEPSTVIDASIVGEPFAGRKSSSVFPRFSFRWSRRSRTDLRDRDVKSLSDHKESSLCGVACSEPRLVGFKQVVL